MKRIMILFVLFMALAMMGNAYATERLGPASVTDHWMEASLGFYANKTDNTNQDNTAGPGAIASLWYVKPKPVHIGIEGMIFDWGQGGFLSGRTAIDNDWTLIAGVGLLGYKVDTKFGDYYTHEPALMVGTSYQTEFGRVVARYIVTESDKNHYVATSDQTCIGPEHSERPKCETSVGSKKYQTENTKSALSVGLQFEY